MRIMTILYVEKNRHIFFGIAVAKKFFLAITTLQDYIYATSQNAEAPSSFEVVQHSKSM